jgi:hypothetical protein
VSKVKEADELRVKQAALVAAADEVLTKYQTATTLLWSKTRARVILGGLLHSIADRAGVAWTEVDEVLTDKFFDAFENEIYKSMDERLGDYD